MLKYTLKGSSVSVTSSGNSTSPNTTVIGMLQLLFSVAVCRRRLCGTEVDMETTCKKHTKLLQNNVIKNGTVTIAFISVKNALFKTYNADVTFAACLSSTTKHGKKL